jgi:hypothetical protein
MGTIIKKLKKKSTTLSYKSTIATTSKIKILAKKANNSENQLK